MRAHATPIVSHPYRMCAQQQTTLQVIVLNYPKDWCHSKAARSVSDCFEAQHLYSLTLVRSVWAPLPLLWPELHGRGRRRLAPGAASRPELV